MQSLFNSLSVRSVRSVQSVFLFLAVLAFEIFVTLLFAR